MDSTIDVLQGVPEVGGCATYICCFFLPFCTFINSFLHDLIPS